MYTFTNMKNRVGALFIFFTSLLFISRFFLFVTTQDAGIEHDSGWYLGVARNVAERGIYASYTNTIATTEKAGAFPSIHNRFSVQDKNGFVYFPAGVTVGPGYVLPEAFFLKFFGTGWAQFRLWPFIAFCLLIPLLFILILQVGSYSALIFFQIWLWCYPQLFLSLSFEAFSEHIALLFLLLGFLAFQKWLRSPGKILFVILSGLSFGVSFQTKNIFVLGSLFSILSAFFIAKKTKSIRPAFLFLLFFLIPTIMFETYRFISLYFRFGLAGYNAVNIDIARTWQSGGSGITTFLNGFHPRFLYQKLSVWKHIGANPIFLAWPLVFISPLVHRKKIYLYWTFFISALIFFIWFGALSTTGWFRHILPGIILGMIIVSLTVGDVLFRAIKIKQVILRFVALLFLGGISYSIFFNPLSLPQFAITKKQEEAVYKALSPNTLQGPQFAPVFSQKDEAQIASFIDTSIPKTTRICYYEWALVAELPPLVNRVFFPYPRCKTNDILIIGPYQKGIYTINHTDFRLLVKKLCDKTIFNNTMYTACLKKKP